MRDGEWVKAHYLDASALVMLVADEPGCQDLRGFFNSDTNFCTTSLCLAEALGVLKRKWSKKQLTSDQYFSATQYLIINAWGQKPKIDDLGLYQPSVQFDVEAVAKKHQLDVSDALQLATIKKGYFSGMVGPSASVLITGDQGLAAAATAEGIRVWNCKASGVPPW